jgi:hypothetical protein
VDQRQFSVLAIHTTRLQSRVRPGAEVHRPLYTNVTLDATTTIRLRSAASRLFVDISMREPFMHGNLVSRRLPGSAADH